MIPFRSNLPQSLWLRVLTCCVATLLTAGCGSPREDAPAGPVIVTSIPPHAWLARQVAGPTAQVQCILSPGDSPETFQPDDATITRATRATIYLAAGVPFENGRWFNALTASDAVTVVDLREGVTLRAMVGHHDHGHGHSHAHGVDEQAMDPHTWTSPANLRIQAEHIARVLTARYPEHRDAYAVNLAAVLSELEILDKDIAEILARHQGRTMLVYHPAWGYFADRYGLELVAVESDGKAPSDSELMHMQSRARDEGVQVVFVQPQVGKQTARRIAEGIGGQVVVIDPLSENVPGNLRRVARVIRDAFDQSVPPADDLQAPHEPHSEHAHEH